MKDRYRLLVLDLDGTLLTSRRELSPRTIDAVHVALRAGTKVVVASARPVRALIPFYTALSLVDPLVALNGCLAYDVHRARVRHARAIDQTLAIEIVGVIRSRGLNVIIESDIDWYVDRLEGPIARDVERGAIVPPAVVGNVDAGIGDGLPVYKIMASLTDPERTAERVALEEWLMRTVAPHVTVDVAPDGTVELRALGVSKEAAEAQLAAEWSIDPADAIAVGDDVNDLGMIRWAGIGVAMGNAHAQVKDAAQHVTASNDADGVAAVIERFLVSRRSCGKCIAAESDTRHPDDAEQ